MNRYGNSEYERVSKRTARRLFNEGTKIYALPCKMRLVDSSYGFMWKPIFLGCKGFSYLFPNEDFESLSNECTHYNCNSGAGYYLAYFKEV